MNLTVQEVFEQSSNIGMARLIDKTLGNNPQRFVDYMHQLSLSQPLDLKMAGVGTPLIKHPKSPGLVLRGPLKVD